LLAQASGTSAHLLDHRFDGILTESERALQAALEDFLAAVPQAAQRAPAWSSVESLIRRLGGLPFSGGRKMNTR
jgi:hypothetical protein